MTDSSRYRSAPLHTPPLYPIESPIPIRIHKPLSRQPLRVLLAPPRQLRAQSPTRVHLWHHQLDELQILRRLDAFLCKNELELHFGGRVVETGIGGRVVVEREQVRVVVGDDVVVCCFR